MNYPLSAALYLISPTVSCCEHADLPAAPRGALISYTMDLEIKYFIKKKRQTGFDNYIFTLLSILTYMQWD